ncbi:DUF4347 domain-containing protein, partial [Roseospira goensis]
MTTPSQSASQSSSIPSGTAAPGRTVYVLDAAVPDLETLLQGVPDQAETVLLSGGRDGVADLAARLAGHTGIAALHIVCHGRDGALMLGNAVLSTDTLDAYAPELRAVARALRDGADILLYGCAVARTETGAAFVAALAAATGANVAASRTPTGAADQGGDWALDVRVGAVTTAVGFSAGARARFAAVLGPSDENFDGRESGTYNDYRPIGDWVFKAIGFTSYSVPGRVADSTELPGRNLNQDEEDNDGDKLFMWNEYKVDDLYDFYFATTNQSDFRLESFDFGASSDSVKKFMIGAYRDNKVAVEWEVVNLESSDNDGNITYTLSGGNEHGVYGTLTFGSAFNCVDKILFRPLYEEGVVTTPAIDNIDVSAAIEPNTAPVFHDLGGEGVSVSYTPGGDAVILDADVTVTDAELDALAEGAGSYDNATLTIARSDGANTDDVFAFQLPDSYSFGFEYGYHTITKDESTVVALYKTTDGTFELSFDPGATTDDVNAILQVIQYETTDTSSGDIELTWTFDDGSGADNATTTG